MSPSGFCNQPQLLLADDTFGNYTLSSLSLLSERGNNSNSGVMIHNLHPKQPVDGLNLLYDLHEAVFTFLPCQRCDHDA